MKSIFALCLALSLQSAMAVEPLSYNRDIRPILSDNCFACHGPDKANQKAGLRLDVRDVAIKPMKSGDSSHGVKLGIRDSRLDVSKALLAVSYRTR